MNNDNKKWEYDKYLQTPPIPVNHQTSAPPLTKLKAVQFGLLTPEQVKANSTIIIKTTSTDKPWQRGGLCDVSFGSINRGMICPTCMNGYSTCPGHDGGLDMVYPVASPFLVDMLKRIFECICWCCGSLLIPVTPKLVSYVLKLRPQYRLNYIRRHTSKIFYCGQLQRQKQNNNNNNGNVNEKTPIITKKMMKSKPKKKKRKKKSTPDTPTGASSDNEIEVDDNDDDDIADDVVDDDDDDRKDQEEEETVDDNNHNIQNNDDKVESEKEEEEDEDDNNNNNDDAVIGATSPTITTTSNTNNNNHNNEKITPKKRGKIKKINNFGAPFLSIDQIKQFGCGAPVPKLTRIGLTLHALFCLEWQGDLNKQMWPTFNLWTAFQLCRALSPQVQELLGLNFKESPAHALFIRYLNIPSPGIRQRKEDSKTVTSQDENTQTLKEIQNDVKKKDQNLKENGIKTPLDLPSSSTTRSIIWYVKQHDKYFPCTCSNTDYCNCIPVEYVPISLLTTNARIQQLYKYLSSSASYSSSASSTTTSTSSSLLTTTKRDPVLDLDLVLTSYLIGGTNQKGSGKKDVKNSQTSWGAKASLQAMAAKKGKCIASRLVGKRGRFRGSMYGKRCNKTARTVASGCIYANVPQIGTPKAVAEILLTCEPVTLNNRIMKIDNIRNREVDYIQLKTNSNTDIRNVRFLNPDCYVPPIGSVCEQHLTSGKIVLWGRQPTLHQPSMQSANTLILRNLRNGLRPRRTLAINHCSTYATNADFDGDEFNLHLCQTVESQAELQQLMSVYQQIRSQQGASVMIVLVQNSRLALWILTDPKTWLTRTDFFQLLYQFGKATTETEIQQHFEIHNIIDRMNNPIDIKNKQWFTGLDVISALLPPNIFYRTPNRKNPNNQCVINNSIMVQGRLNGDDVGPGVSGNLIHRIVQDCGESYAIAWLSGIQRVLNYFIMQYGTTMNRDDYGYGGGISEFNMQKIYDKYKTASNYIVNNCQNYDLRNSQNDDERKTALLLEKVINTSTQQLLNHLQHQHELGYRRNGVLDLYQSQTKGKERNLIQLGAMVGQQMPSNGRIVGLVSHFLNTLNSPEAHGFIPECYRDGLSPRSFFSGSISSREALVGTCSATPLVGYFQRCLGNGLADLHACADKSVRDCRNRIVQTCYGGNGFDPAYLEANKLAFITPYDKATPELQFNQHKLMSTMAKLYECSPHLPNYVLLPFNVQQLFIMVVNNQNNNNNINNNSLQEYYSAFIASLIKNNLLFDKTDPRHNELLFTILQDMFSPYAIITLHHLNKDQLFYMFELVEKSLARSLITDGEAVGIDSAQSIGQPAMQTTLNHFHVAGQQTSTQSVVSQLKYTAYAGKKQTFSSMMVRLNPPWNTKKKWINRVKRDIIDRRLLNFVLHIQVYKPGEIGNKCIQHSLQYRYQKAHDWFQQFPVTQIEFDVKKCKQFQLSLLEISTSIEFAF